jgi:hypothetical protein
LVQAKKILFGRTKKKAIVYFSRSSRVRPVGVNCIAGCACDGTTLLKAGD